MRGYIGRSAAGVSLLALTATGLYAGATAAAAQEARPATTSLTGITISSFKSGVTLSATSVRAGTYRFTVKAGKGDHSLQLVKLHHGYTVKQIESDAQAAYSPDGLAAARRLDRRATWLGGYDAVNRVSGVFTATVTKGTVYVVDENTGKYTKLHVSSGHGSTHVAYNVHLVGRDGERWGSPGHFARSGTALFTDSSDEPHFVVLNRIKDSTTPSDIRRYIASGSSDAPAFLDKASIDTTTISPGQSMTFDYSLPAGKYLLACFWPSDDMAGVDHFAMGMWKIVHLS